MNEECKFPNLKESTGYSYGCRCSRCRGWSSAYQASYYLDHRPQPKVKPSLTQEEENARRQEKLTKARERNRLYREKNPEKIAEKKRKEKEIRREKREEKSSSKIEISPTQRRLNELERKRAYREKNPEKLRAYRNENQRKIKAYARKYRAENAIYLKIEGEGYVSRVKSSCPKIVSGPYSSSEDLIIARWEGRNEDLARNLGRTYRSVVMRKARLRKQGLL